MYTMYKEMFSISFTVYYFIIKYILLMYIDINKLLFSAMINFVKANFSFVLCVILYLGFVD